MKPAKTTRKRPKRKVATRSTARRRVTATAAVADIQAAGTSAPPTHDAFLADLLGAFPNEVYLAGRLVNGELGLSADAKLRVFLPDFHWMSSKCLKLFDGNYRFNNGTLGTARDSPFERLLSVLERLPEGSREVYQLGDRFDLWREWVSLRKDTKRDKVPIADVYRRVREDKDVGPLADRLDAVITKYVRGNHDAWLSEVEKPGAAIPPSEDAISVGGTPLRLEHGKRFDLVELLPDAFKASAVAFAPHLKAGEKDIGLFSKDNMERIKSVFQIRKEKRKLDIHVPVWPDGACLVQGAADVDTLSASHTCALDADLFAGGPGGTRELDDYPYAGYFRPYAELADRKAATPVIYVVGHTHHARLVSGHTRNQDRLVVLMDCGGWVERCSIRKDVAGGMTYTESRQIGVQFGNDIRIYQLGGTVPE